VTDVNLFVSAAHADVGDLVGELALANADGTLARTLFSAGTCPGTTGLITTLDDEATSPLGTTCPAIGGTYTTNPVGGLDGFDGQSVRGSWTLRLADGALNGRTGTLLNWTLDLTTAGTIDNP
jgi:hypothetical protein